MDISVVITTRNRPAFLIEALSGLSLQTKKPKEVIVIDDCSEESYQKASDFITGISNTLTALGIKNAGVSKALALAEIGISTDKLHARGPVGLEGLTSLKYIVLGDGHIRQ